MNILFVVPYTPNLIRVRPYQLIRHLAQRGNQITLAALWSSHEEQADLDRLAAETGITVLAQPLPRWRSAWNSLRALPTRAPIQASYCWQPSLAQALQAQLDAAEPAIDVVHVEHLRGARYGVELKRRGAEVGVSECQSVGVSECQSVRVSEGGGRLPVVWDSVDCISHLFAQAAQESRSLKGRLMTRLELERTRRYEGWLTHQFDRVLVTSPIDRDALAALAASTQQPQAAAGGQITNRESRIANHRSQIIDRKSPIPSDFARGTPVAIRHSPFTTPISVLPNGVDLSYFTPTDEPREPATLVFSGKMSYHANVTAALFLVKDVMPLVWAQRPDVQVQIVGKDPAPEILNLNSQIPPPPCPIHITGTVPDIRPYLRRATLAVAPVPYGAGIQNKVLEAMACATPVVASPQAVSALQARPNQHLVTAAGAAEFAVAILTLLDEPATRARLGRAGRAYVQQNHAWEAIAQQLEQVYCQVLGT